MMETDFNTVHPSDFRLNLTGKKRKMLDGEKNLSLSKASKKSSLFFPASSVGPVVPPPPPLKPPPLTTKELREKHRITCHTRKTEILREKMETVRTLSSFHAEGVELENKRDKIVKLVKNSDDQSTALAAHDTLTEWCFAHQTSAITLFDKWGRYLEAFHNDTMLNYLIWLEDEGQCKHRCPVHCTRSSSESLGDEECEGRCTVHCIKGVICPSDFDKPIGKGRKRNGSMFATVAEKKHKQTVRAPRSRIVSTESAEAVRAYRSTNGKYSPPNSVKNSSRTRRNGRKPITPEFVPPGI